MNDLETGRKVLKAYYDYSRFYYPTIYKFSFDEFLKKYQPNQKKLEIYLDGIGFGVRGSEISQTRINSAMQKMVLNSKGGMPSNAGDFFKYLSNEAVKISYIGAIGFVAVESLKDVAKGAAAVGDSLLTTGKILTFIFPVIVLILVFFWVNSKTGGGLGRGLKSLRG